MRRSPRFADRVGPRAERARGARAEAFRIDGEARTPHRRCARTGASSGTRGRRPDVTGSIAPKQQDRPAVVAGWVIREVFDGRAVIENERLGFYEVVPGANLPGVGRVETIRRQDGRWVVVTPKGLIVSAALKLR